MNTKIKSEVDEVKKEEVNERASTSKGTSEGAAIVIKKKNNFKQEMVSGGGVVLLYILCN
jgi:hypothetical protein